MELLVLITGVNPGNTVGILAPFRLDKDRERFRRAFPVIIGLVKPERGWDDGIQIQLGEDAFVFVKIDMIQAKIIPRVDPVSYAGRKVSEDEEKPDAESCEGLKKSGLEYSRKSRVARLTYFTS